MRGAIPPPQYVFMGWCLVKHRDSFTLFRLYDLEYICVECICQVTLYISNRDSLNGKTSFYITVQNCFRATEHNSGGFTSAVFRTRNHV
jgi:hypothetical protein